ncbi:hypothetical protein CW708_01095 [Candidatus Bathyarchaeota archaeon]|nr:MAG: hypothetical protein CW708_01095 [Candidatus Bathyarchaeota archaeon]
MNEDELKFLVVWLILNGEVEKALEFLAKHYHTEKPKLKVGLPKGRKRKALGCYDSKTRTIHVLNSEIFNNPFVILHEFYHHLRTTIDKKHKGTEKYADKFAEEYIQVYKRALHASKK